MAPVDLRAASQPQSRLLSLPAEIQIMIFNYAYARSADIQYVARTTWRKRGRVRKRVSPDKLQFNKRPFPGPTVLELMVSKDFFALAAKAYVLSQPTNRSKAYFTTPGGSGFGTYCSPGGDSIFMRFAEDSITDSFILPLGAHNVKRIIVRLTRSCFMDLRSRFSTDSEIPHTPARAATFRGNSASYEQYVRSEILELRAADADVSSAVATQASQVPHLRQRPQHHAEPSSRLRASAGNAMEMPQTPLQFRSPSSTTNGKRRRQLLDDDRKQDVPKKRKIDSKSLTTPSAKCYASTELDSAPEMHGSSTLSSAPTAVAAPHSQPDAMNKSSLTASLMLAVAISLSAVLPKLEALLDAGDPVLASWVNEMKSRGKL